MSDDFIQDAARRLFANEVGKSLIETVEQGAFPETLWGQVNELGFTRLFASEAAGGIEAAWNDAYPVLHNLGYYQAPIPLAETAIAHLILSAAGRQLDTQRPIAIFSAHDGQALSSANEAAICAQLRDVKWACASSHLLIGLPEGECAVVALDGNGVQLSRGKDLSGMPADRVNLDGAKVVERFTNPFPDLTDPVKTLAAGARAMMMVGALEFALDTSVQYAKDRIQFGKSIGKNQAIQQQLALMAGEFAVARAAAVMAANDMPSLGQVRSPSAEFSVAAAKVSAGEATGNGTSIAHQVHGAIGFTYEHPLNFATRRLWAWRGDFGNAAWWARELGRGYIGQGGSAFWPNLTDRRLQGQIASEGARHEQ